MPADMFKADRNSERIALACGLGFADPNLAVRQFDDGKLGGIRGGQGEMGGEGLAGGGHFGLAGQRGIRGGGACSEGVAQLGGRRAFVRDTRQQVRQ